MGPPPPSGAGSRGSTAATAVTTGGARAVAEASLWSPASARAAAHATHSAFPSGGFTALPSANVLPVNGINAGATATSTASATGIAGTPGAPWAHLNTRPDGRWDGIGLSLGHFVDTSPQASASTSDSAEGTGTPRDPSRAHANRGGNSGGGDVIGGVGFTSTGERVDGGGGVMADGENEDSRRQALVENLINMGFPIDWAIGAADQCDVTVSASLAESMAIAWIIDQMELEHAKDEEEDEEEEGDCGEDEDDDDDEDEDDLDADDDEDEEDREDDCDGDDVHGRGMDSEDELEEGHGDARNMDATLAGGISGRRLSSSVLPESARTIAAHDFELGTPFDAAAAATGASAAAAAAVTGATLSEETSAIASGTIIEVDASSGDLGVGSSTSTAGGAEEEKSEDQSSDQGDTTQTTSLTVESERARTPQVPSLSPPQDHNISSSDTAASMVATQQDDASSAANSFLAAAALMRAADPLLTPRDHQQRSVHGIHIDGQGGSNGGGYSTRRRSISENGHSSSSSSRSARLSARFDPLPSAGHINGEAPPPPLPNAAAAAPSSSASVPTSMPAGDGVSAGLAPNYTTANSTAGSHSVDSATSLPPVAGLSGAAPWEVLLDDNEWSTPALAREAPFMPHHSAVEPTCSADKEGAKSLALVNRAPAHRRALRRSLRRPRLMVDSFLPPSSSTAAPSPSAAVDTGSTDALREVQDLGSTCADEELAPLCLLAFTALAVLHARSAAVALLSAAAATDTNLANSRSGATTASATRFDSLVAAIQPTEDAKPADRGAEGANAPVAGVETSRPPSQSLVPPKPALWRLWRLVLFRSSPLVHVAPSGVHSEKSLSPVGSSAASPAGAKPTLGTTSGGPLAVMQHLEATLLSGTSFYEFFRSNRDDENNDNDARIEGNGGRGNSIGKSGQGAAESVLRALIEGAVDRCVAATSSSLLSSSTQGPTPSSPSNAGTVAAAAAATNTIQATKLGAQVRAIAAMVKQTVHDSIAELELAAQPALRRVPWAPSAGRLALNLSEDDALKQPNPELSAWLLSALARLAAVHSPRLRAAASSLRTRRRVRTHANSSGILSARARRSRSVTSTAPLAPAAAASPVASESTSAISFSDAATPAPAGSAAVPLSARDSIAASFDNFSESDVIEDAAWALTKALDQALSPLMSARLGRLATRAPSLPLRQMAMELAGQVLNAASLRIGTAAASAAAVGVHNRSTRLDGPVIAAANATASASAAPGPALFRTHSSSALVPSPRAPSPPLWLLLHAGAAPYRQRGTERELLASFAARLRKDAAAASFLNWAACPMLYAPDEPAVLGVANLLAQWHSFAAVPQRALLAQEVWGAAPASHHNATHDSPEELPRKKGAVVKLPALRLVDVSSTNVALAWEEVARDKEVADGETSRQGGGSGGGGTGLCSIDAKTTSANGGNMSPGCASTATNETSFDESDERSALEGGHSDEVAKDSLSVVQRESGGDEVDLGDPNGNDNTNRSIGASGLLGLFEEDPGNDLGLVSSATSLSHQPGSVSSSTKADAGVEHNNSEEGRESSLVLEYRLQFRRPGTGLGDRSCGVINSSSTRNGNIEAELQDIENIDVYNEDSDGADDGTVNVSGHESGGGWLVAADNLPPDGSGTFSLDGLAPDTAYEFRLVESWRYLLTEAAAAAAEQCGSTAAELEVERAGRQQAKSVRQRNARRQTPFSVTTCPEPPFMLDATAKGPNLKVIQSGRTVANGVNKQWNAVRASTGWCEGIHRWEVIINVYFRMFYLPLSIP